MKNYIYDYQKIINEKYEVYNNIMIDKEYGKKDINILLRKLLLLFVIDANSYNLPVLKDTSLVEKLINYFEKNVDETFYLNENKINTIIDTISKYRISNELNKKIVLLYANYYNSRQNNEFLIMDLSELAKYCDSI